MLLSGMIADLLQKKKIMSTTYVRKLANGVGKWPVFVGTAETAGLDIWRTKSLGWTLQDWTLRDWTLVDFRIPGPKILRRAANKKDSIILSSSSLQRRVKVKQFRCCTVPVICMWSCVSWLLQGLQLLMVTNFCSSCRPQSCVHSVVLQP